MNHSDVMQWVADYERAWRDGDVEAVEQLFTDDAAYRASPYEESLVGHDAIKGFWLDDEGRVFTARAWTVAVEAPARSAVVRVDVRYGDPVRQEYRDVWLLRFAEDGRVEDFEEWAYWPGRGYSTGSDEPPSGVRQLRLVVEADDFDRAVPFYRDVLGLREQAAFEGDGDARVVILDAGRATLELANPGQKRMIDEVEANGRPSPRIRVAFEVDDSRSTTEALVDAGATLVADPVVTPWRSLNSRLDGPAGLQLTLFQELDELNDRIDGDGFGTHAERHAGAEE